MAAANLMRHGWRCCRHGMARFPLTIAWTSVALGAAIGLLTSPVFRTHATPSVSASDGPRSSALRSDSPIKPPLQAVDPVERALARLDDVCDRAVLPVMTTRLHLLTKPAHTVAGFAQRYPDARFLIHGQTATTGALLTVVRTQLGSCAPTLVALLAARP